MNGNADPLDALGQYALRYVKPGHTIGLGTGRAASAFIRALGASGIKVRGVPTSTPAEELARSVGIEIVTLTEANKIDSDFDGADEVDRRLNVLKGYGGALVREKIVAASSRRFIVLIGEEKLVPKLGHRGSLPVEVVPFGVALAIKRIKALGLRPKIRTIDGKEFVTDNGNSILDCGVKTISNPGKLDRDLLAIPGVIGTGLFVGMVNLVLVASASGKIRSLRETKRAKSRPR
jgi:ribose 5-phosphate isomerase A